MSAELFELLRSKNGYTVKTSYDDGDEITALYKNGRFVAERVITHSGDILFNEV